MHLGSLTISRFRSCDNVTVSFRPDLTVLVGENNGGKSNVEDAIRLLTLPLSGRRERYPEDEMYGATRSSRTSRSKAFSRDSVRRGQPQELSSVPRPCGNVAASCVGAPLVLYLSGVDAKRMLVSAAWFILKKAVGNVARALKMLKMEDFFVKLWRTRSHPAGDERRDARR